MDVYSWFRRSLSRTTKTTTTTTTTTVTAQPDDELLYGVTDELLDFIKSFSIDTFRNFSLPDEDDGDTPENVRKDLSDWQQRHALLVLSKLKELSQLRFKLCPRFLKDHQFWTIYFALVKGFVAKYELHAIQLDKLKQMRLESENTPDVAACEVEMSEAKKTTDVLPTISEEHN
ncbi:hypothetical protein R3W88_024756 [Solanum pinnatisectum]|uniref:BSD domain-containing protein n=1 Tax=Solanum pinnatisectum TaxID=50273 RepID=A0AAV9K3C9_9SOLN|nr:hypothetical protein R3W88_033701 [Solanum pinnatisectum]KAK4731768.1 hypothetical protein R3W88_024756 [Solanum pinnatisectum]